MSNIHDVKEVLEKLIRHGLSFPGYTPLVHLSLMDVDALHTALRYIEKAEQRTEKAKGNLLSRPVCCKCEGDFVKKKGDLCESCEDSFKT